MFWFCKCNIKTIRTISCFQSQSWAASAQRTICPLGWIINRSVFPLPVSSCWWLLVNCRCLRAAHSLLWQITFTRWFTALQLRFNNSLTCKNTENLRIKHPNHGGHLESVWSILDRQTMTLLKVSIKGIPWFMRYFAKRETNCVTSDCLLFMAPIIRLN